MSIITRSGARDGVDFAFLPWSWIYKRKLLHDWRMGVALTGDVLNYGLSDSATSTHSDFFEAMVGSTLVLMTFSHYVWSSIEEAASSITHLLLRHSIPCSHEVQQDGIDEVIYLSLSSKSYKPMHLPALLRLRLPPMPLASRSSDLLSLCDTPYYDNTALCDHKIISPF